jgi:TolB-like protein
LSIPTLVAVLPFVNLSGDTRNEHVADGLTEHLITHLANMQSLRVVSRTSSMQYKYTRRKVVDIARELNVTRIVEGSVLRSERTMQVVVQLIDPGTDTRMFSRIYTRDLGDILQAQHEVTQCIGNDLAEFFGATQAND